jgi:hypothetical protein
MWQSLKRPGGWMLLGGTLVALGFLAGVWVGDRDRPESAWSSRFPGLAEQVLEASTATSGENFALATGAIDQDAEGVFVLDFLTGTLKCAVLNHRSAKFAALFQTNVAQDLGIAKNGKYLMVTGLVNFVRGANLYRPSLSVVYVLETNTGNMVAYGIPWQREAAATVRPQIGTLIPIDAMKVRTISIRDQ